MNLPVPLRMMTVVPSDNLGHPTIEGLQQSAELIAKLNARPNNPINMALAGVVPTDQQDRAQSSTSTSAAEDINPGFAKLNARPNNMALAGVVPADQHDRAQSPASTSTSPAEDINPGFQGTSGKTPSRHPQQVRREDDWVPTMTRGFSMAMSDAPAPRGREPGSTDETR